MLKAYTLHRPEEGYCQAQAPIAAVLLMHMPAEVSHHASAPPGHLSSHMYLLTVKKHIRVNLKNTDYGSNNL